MEIIEVNPDEVVSVETLPTKSDFIVANTLPIHYSELRNKCIIPVFAKDNESTISHSDFIDIVGDVTRRYFSGELISPPAIRVSHPIKGRIPQAMGKPANELMDHEKTIYYERMAFMYELPNISGTVGGNTLSLSVGGVRAYNNDSLSGRKGKRGLRFLLVLKIGFAPIFAYQQMDMPVIFVLPHYQNCLTGSFSFLQDSILTGSLST